MKKTNQSWVIVIKNPLNRYLHQTKQAQAKNLRWKNLQAAKAMIMISKLKWMKFTSTSKISMNKKLNIGKSRWTCKVNTTINNLLGKTIRTKIHNRSEEVALNQDMKRTNTIQMPDNLKISRMLISSWATRTQIQVAIASFSNNHGCLIHC